MQLPRRNGLGGYTQRVATSDIIVGAVLGGTGTLIASIISAVTMVKRSDTEVKSRVRQAQEDFLRVQRQIAYAAYLASIQDLFDLIGDFRRQVSRENVQKIADHRSLLNVHHMGMRLLASRSVRAIGDELNQRVLSVHVAAMRMRFFADEKTERQKNALERLKTVEATLKASIDKFIDAAREELQGEELPSAPSHVDPSDFG